jgi:hypothetical protein
MTEQQRDKWNVFDEWRALSPAEREVSSFSSSRNRSMTDSDTIQQRLLQERKARTTYVSNIYSSLSSTHAIQSEESAQKTEELEINDLKSLVSDLCTLSSYTVCGERAIANMRTSQYDWNHA